MLVMVRGKNQKAFYSVLNARKADQVAMLPCFSMLVHRKSAKFWPLKRFDSSQGERLGEAHKDLYSANLKPRKAKAKKNKKKI